MHKLEVTNLTKDFGNKKGAFDINFSLEPGQTIGFIGPNGAGKSTTLNMLSGFIKPDSGEIRIFGQNVNWLNIHNLYPRIGVLLSEVAFEKNLKPSQIFGQSEMMLNRNLKSKWQELAEFLELDVNKKFASLSYGNRKKVGIINCLMHDPELVLLDEPTGGLDPLIQQKFFSLLKKITDKDGSVLLSSHVLGEVQSACDRIMMIKNGKIILQDTTKNILDKASRVFKIKNPSKDLLDILHNQNTVIKTETFGEEILIYTDKHPKILEILVENKVFDFYLEKPSLEEMFLQFYK
jgi:ABC-2 type transport system ATP-binding protein